MHAAAAVRGRYKRLFDLPLALIAGICVLPLALLVALAIRVGDGGRVIYAQQRMGRHGRVFRIFKFRTMVEDAERDTGPVLARRRDARLTRIGRLLRRLHLDEIPQLVNVIKGDMSLVGPRPERPELVARIESAVPDFGDRLAVRPGIAGLAQGRADYDPLPRNKLRYDKLYIASMSPLLDCKILALCVVVVIRRTLQAALRILSPSASRASRASCASRPGKRDAEVRSGRRRQQFDGAAGMDDDCLADRQT